MNQTWFTITLFIMGTSKSTSQSPTIENRRARHDYHILDTLEAGIVLKGSEVKSLRAGQASLAEGWVRATQQPLSLILHAVHIAEYPNAGPAHQHQPQRPRTLLAHRREICKLADFTSSQGRTLVPLKLYFSNGKAKLLIGLATGKHKADKRQSLAMKDAKREMERALKKRR